MAFHFAMHQGEEMKVRTFSFSIWQQDEWFPYLIWRPATHMQPSESLTALPISQANKLSAIHGSALSQPWVCAMGLSRGARQPNRQKVPHWALSFCSCFIWNSFFILPRADRDSDPLWEMGKASLSSSHWAMPPAQLCWPWCCLLGWLKTEKRNKKEKWQVAAAVEPDQEAFPPWDKQH